MKFKAITNDKRQLDIRWDLVHAYLSRWKPGTALDVEIKRRQPKRSDPLRKMYFAGVLKPLCEWSGYEPDELLEVHKYLKARYFNIEPDERGIYRNKDIPSVFSNQSDIPVNKKREFVDWVVRLAAKSGCYIDLEGVA